MNDDPKRLTPKEFYAQETARDKLDDFLEYHRHTLWGTYGIVALVLLGCLVRWLSH